MGNAHFRLDETFRKSLAGPPLGVDIPPGALVFMDYHFDWIHAAAHLHVGQRSFDGPPEDNAGKVATGNQEDIDLVIAYEDSGVNHLVMLEAKAETGFTNKQMDSKVKRLSAIFGMDGNRAPGVVPHFSLVSPRPPQRLVTLHWPEWMLLSGEPKLFGREPKWMELHVPPGRVRMERYDPATRKAAKSGSHFRFVQRKPR